MTYGDMMSLLLCFFIMLVALSEIKKEEFRVKAEAIKSSFASSITGGGVIPGLENPDFSVISLLTEKNLQLQEHKNQSRNEEEGIEGKTNTVRQIREGILEPVGGLITFEPGSAQLTAEAKRRIRDIVPRIRGELNKIELRGHASSIELVHSTGYKDLWELSYDRAKAVMEFLVNEAGIRRDRIRISANADNEPLRQRDLSRSAQEPNRRVEIIVMEAIVDDFTKPELTGSH